MSSDRCAPLSTGHPPDDPLPNDPLPQTAPTSICNAWQTLRPVLARAAADFRVRMLAGPARHLATLVPVRSPRRRAVGRRNSRPAAGVSGVRRADCRKGSGGHGVDPSPWRWWSRVFDDCVDLAPEVDTVETGDECRRTSRCGVDEVLEPESALASDLLSGAGDRRRGRPTRE